MIIYSDSNDENHNNGWREEIAYFNCPSVWCVTCFSIILLKTLNCGVGVLLPWVMCTLTATSRKYFCLNNGNPKCFFQFEISIHVSVSSFRFISIPMLLVYNTAIINMFILLMRGSSLSVRIWHLQTSDSEV